jgi:PAS domain S-box-containing protein
MNQYQMLEGISEKSESCRYQSNPKLPDWAGEILEDVDLGVFIVDRRLKFVNGNSFVEGLIGKGRDDIVGKYLFDVIPLFDISEWGGLYNDVLMNGSTFKKEGLSYEYTQNNGKPINNFFNISLYPLRDELNGVVGVVTVIKEITSEVRLRKEIRELKEIIEDFIEEAEVGILVLDKDQKIIRYNRKAEENTKVTKERVLNLEVNKAFPRNTMRPPLFAAHRDMFENNMPYDISFDLYIPQVNDGKSTFRLRGTPLGKEKGYVIFVDREDSFYETKREIKEKTKDLKLSTNFLYHLIDASPNVVISIDNCDGVISFNKTAERIYGFNITEVLGCKYYFLFSEEENERIRKIILSDTSHWESEVTGLRKDGSNFPTRLSISKIVDEDGNRIALLFLIEDITEKKKIRQSLIQSKKMADLGEMIGGLAHQLNNPLVGVVNMADILTRRVGKDAPTFELVKTIGEAASECRKITNSLLKFSKKSKSVFSELDLIQTLENSLLLVKQQSFLNGISIIKKYDRDVPRILGDETQLQQVFLNVIVNAVQAMLNGGDLRVEVRNSEGMRLSRRNGFVDVRFIDTGVGIPSENLDKIFDPFFTTKDADNGTGLGLSIAYTIVKEHNGKIDVDSVEGKGTTFTIRLPTQNMQ